MRRTERVPITETESDLVVAIFRTIFIVIVAFSPAFLPEARSTSHLRLSLALAGVYNLGLMLVYWQRWRFRFQRHLVAAVDLLLISLWIYYSGPLGEHFFPLYYITVLVCGFWFGVAGAATSAAIAGILYLAAMSTLSPSSQAQAMVASALQERIPFLFLIALVVSYIADAQARERQGWYEARLFLARHQERIRLGQRIYDMLQPGTLPAVPGLDIGVRFRPAATAGAGDYYEVFSFADNRAGVVLADVAGKLEPGLVKLPLVRAALRVSVDTDPAPSPLVRQVNRLLYPDLQPDMFVSLTYALFDLKERKLHCAVAGQEPPIHVSSSKASDIPATGMVLGVVAELESQAITVELAPGDAVVFFTDGATEAQDQAGEEFGADRLRDAARSANAPDLSAQGLADRLIDLIMNFAPPSGRRDDMTILVVKMPLA